MVNIENSLNQILSIYQEKFKTKKIVPEETDSDVLMAVFGVTYAEKAVNMQYWGRELGTCWERLVQSSLESHKDYLPGLQIGRDELCDCIVGKYAIDAKYRVGSGDSGTLKKFKQYGQILKKKGYVPIMLFLRTDNLAAAITAAKTGEWTIKSGKESFDFVKSLNGFDLEKYLSSSGRKFLH